MIFNWTNRDSDNLESIAKSLERLAEREVIRKNDEGVLTKFLRRTEEAKEIAVYSPNIGEAFDEEHLKMSERIQGKLEEAEKNKNAPFFYEDSLNAEELDNL